MLLEKETIEKGRVKVVDGLVLSHATRSMMKAMDHLRR
jgi:hypothetical protein